MNKFPLGILAGALARLEKHRSPSKFGSGPEYDTMSYLAPHMSFVYKLALANLWMFSDLVSSVLAGDENIDAVQRTTTAITIMDAGFKENVVPGSARAIVNHRLHPAEVLDDIVKHDEKVIDDDRVKIKTLGYNPPPPVSSYSNDVTPFQIVANSAIQVSSFLLTFYREKLGHKTNEKINCYVTYNILKQLFYKL